MPRAFLTLFALALAACATGPDGTLTRTFWLPTNPGTANQYDDLERCSGFYRIMAENPAQLSADRAEAARTAELYRSRAELLATKARLGRMQDGEDAAANLNWHEAQVRRERARAMDSDTENMRSDRWAREMDAACAPLVASATRG